MGDATHFIDNTLLGDDILLGNITLSIDSDAPFFDDLDAPFFEDAPLLDDMPFFNRATFFDGASDDDTPHASTLDDWDYRVLELELFDAEASPIISPRSASPAFSIAFSMDDELDGTRPDSPLAMPPPLSDEEEDSDDEVKAADLDNDPLFRTREELFDELDAADDPADEDPLDLDELLPAFLESPLICNTYIIAFLQAVYHGATNQSVQLYLESQYELFLSVERQTGAEVAGLATMAHTLRTVERRLRLDPDAYIVYHFVCNICWFRHHPSECHGSLHFSPPSSLPSRHRVGHVLQLPPSYVHFLT
ncbi:hypothetical protein EWM64_g4155 [Hericium alpestre]|uniref:Uncharacterized protein n=1 Tax=Hericium alpestre TaxID=135208 RepID=A0A4Y9ZY88_9AGAM|nr:hypothetical protein EWM64_g4155 [Hericium alpestre]